VDLNALKRDIFQVWAPFGDAEVLIEYVPRDELHKLGKKARTIAFEKHQKVEEMDPVEGDRLLGRRAVKDWRPRPGHDGFTMGTDAEGKAIPFPYSPENCDLLMTKWTAFAKFVNEIAVDLEQLTAIEQELRRKN
jgi:hypothetical protein